MTKMVIHLNNPMKKIAYFIALFVAVACFGIYYYGIQMGLNPDGETMGGVYNAQFAGGNAWELFLQGHILMAIYNAIEPLCGYSYYAFRIGNSIMYAFIALFACGMAILLKIP